MGKRDSDVVVEVINKLDTFNYLYSIAFPINTMVKLVIKTVDLIIGITDNLHCMSWAQL